MDSKMNKQAIPLLRPVLDAREEYVLSNDFVLPEYCPDMAVVLKCMVTPLIHSRQWTAGQLMLEGSATIRVLYLDEERNVIRKAEFNHPISLTVRCEEGHDIPLTQVSVTQEYVNCRATSPRRLEVRGAFSVHAWAHCAQDLPVLSADCKNVHVRRCETEVSSIKAFTERVMVLNDVLDLSSSLPTEDNLLYDAYQVCVQECKLLTGKAIVKGTVYLRQLYGDPKNGDMLPVTHTVPFSQILDLDGAEEGDRCEVNACILSDSFRITGNGEEQHAVLEVAVKVLVQVQAFDCRKVSLVTDAYHSQCPSTLKTQELTLMGFKGMHRHTAVIQRSFDLPSGDIKEILDVWLQLLSSACHCDGTRVLVTQKVNVCMLVKDVNGMIAYFERPEELETEQAVDADHAVAEINVLHVDCIKNGNRLELKAELNACVSVWSKQEHKTVLDVHLQEEEAYPTQRFAVRLYYAKSGENVWDIARECRTSPEGILTENSLHDYSLTEDAVLVVPID